MTIAYVAHVESIKEHDEIMNANMAQSDVHFLTDFNMGEYYKNEICGMQYQGLVISDDARLSKDNLSYLLGRVRHEGELFFRLGDYHKNLLEKHFTDKWKLDGADLSDSFSEDDIKMLKEYERRVCTDLGLTVNF